VYLLVFIRMDDMQTYKLRVLSVFNNLKRTTKTLLQSPTPIWKQVWCCPECIFNSIATLTSVKNKKVYLQRCLVSFLRSLLIYNCTSCSLMAIRTTLVLGDINIGRANHNARFKIVPQSDWSTSIPSIQDRVLNPATYCRDQNHSQGNS